MAADHRLEAGVRVLGVRDVQVDVDLCDKPENAGRAPPSLVSSGIAEDTGRGEQGDARRDLGASPEKGQGSGASRGRGR